MRKSSICWFDSRSGAGRRAAGHLGHRHLARRREARDRLERGRRLGRSRRSGKSQRFDHEAARLEVPLAAVVRGAGQNQPVARPRHADVEQPPLLAIVIGLLVDRIAVQLGGQRERTPLSPIREAPLGELHQEHHRELEALGVVRGQQVDRVLVQLDLGRRRIVAGLDQEVEVADELRDPVAAAAAGRRAGRCGTACSGSAPAPPPRAILRAPGRPSSPLSSTNSYSTSVVGRRDGAVARACGADADEARDRLARGRGQLARRVDRRDTRHAQESAVATPGAGRERRQVDRLDAEQRVAQHLEHRGPVVRIGDRAQHVEAQQDLGARLEAARTRSLERNRRARATPRRTASRCRCVRASTAISPGSRPPSIAVVDFGGHDVGLVAGGAKRAMLDRTLEVALRATVACRVRSRASSRSRIVVPDQPVGGVEDALA